MPTVNAIPTLVVSLAAMAFVLWLVAFNSADHTAFAVWGQSRAGHAPVYAQRRGSHG
jgi:hypothetical protein